MSENKRLYIGYKAGGCRSGSDRRGSIFHAVTGWANFQGGGAALCGASPRIQWGLPWREDQTVTCKKCQKLILQDSRQH